MFFFAVWRTLLTSSVLVIISILYQSKICTSFRLLILIFSLISSFYADNVCHRRPSCWPFSAYSEDPFGMSPKTSSSLPLPVSKASQKTSAFNGRLAPFLINVLQIFLFLKFILYFLIWDLSTSCIQFYLTLV